MHTFKKLFALLMALTMTLSVFSMSAVQALADGEIGFGVYYGFGRTPGSEKLGALGTYTDTGYAILGSRTGSYASGSNSAVGKAPNTNRFSMSINASTKISSVDYYYNGTKYSLAKATAIYSSGGALNTSKTGTQLIANAFNSSTFYSRWPNLDRELYMVLHYTDGHYININTGDENATFTSTDIPEYYYEKTANTGTIEIGGSSYSNSTGISTTVTPNAAPSKILITVGTGETVSIDDATADVYLTSGNAISDTHSSTDILRYNAGEYTFYKVSADINIAYAYSAAEYTVTFMAGENEYDSKVVAGGTPVAAPTTDPEVSHKLFKGWYADAQCSAEFDFTSGINADTTVYAKLVDAHEVTFNGVSSITSTNWNSITGGTIDTTGLLKTEDYAYNTSGVQVGGYFDLGSGNIESVTFTIGEQTVTLSGDDAISTGTIISSDGSYAVRSTPAGDDAVVKYAYSDGNAEFFLRFYSVTQDIDIDVTLKDESHVFYFSGQKSISGSTWASKTGGALNTAGKMTVPGNYVNDPTSATEANGTSKGANFALFTDPSYTVESIVINYGNKTFTVSGTSVTGTDTKYMTATGAMETAWNSSGTTMFKYAHAASSMTTYNFRFFRITRDVKITVNYAEVPETVTATVVDDSEVFTNVALGTGTDSTTFENRVLTIYTAEMLGLNDTALDNDTVQIQIAPRDSMVSGIIVEDTAGNEIGRLERGGTYSSAYVDGFGKMSMVYNANDNGTGYARYYIRFLTVLKNIVIKPILETSEAVDDSCLSMGVEVGNTLTAKFYATLDDEIIAEGYDSYVFKAALGNSTPVELEGTVTSSGQILFSLEQIYAQCMADSITGEFVGIKDGAETVIDTIPTGVSIADYCDRVYASYPTNTALVTFMANMLNYGSKLQLFAGYNTDKLAITGHDWADEYVGAATPSTNIASEEVNVVEEGYDKSEGYIKSAGLNVSEKIAVYFKVYAPNGTDGLRLEVNGYEQTLTAGSDRMCRVQLLRISPANYDSVYTAKLYSGETLLQTVKYSVNTYCDRMFAKGSNTDLVVAIYNYGLAAENYTR